MRAIVMDDSRVVRLALRRTLEGLTFEVTDFPDADSGYVWLQGGGRADLALVDWHMPGMSGVDFVEVVRRDPNYDQMFLVMVSSESAPERMQQALEKGADEYVIKPVAANGLKEKLELLGFRWTDSVER